MTTQTSATSPNPAAPAAGARPVGGAARGPITWLPYVMLGVLLLAVVRWVAAPISNADTFFHLRYGREFLDGWVPWDPGHVSTFGQRDWVPAQWASQVAMATADSVFGLSGVAWLSGVMVLLTVLAVFVIARKYADPLPSVVVTVLVVLATSTNLTGRPQVVSYLLVLLVTHAWLRTAADLRPRWWLVPLTWVWAMVHGMWPVGVLIGLVAIAGIALERRPPAGERAAVARLLAVPLLSLVVAGLTPAGPRLYAAVLLVGGRGKFHDEWAATDFHSRPAVIAAAMLLVTLLVWVTRTGPRPDWTSVLLLLVAAAWCAYAVRTVPVAAVMSVPFVAAALQSLLPRRSAPRRERAVLAALGGAAVLALTVAVPFTADRPASVPAWLDPALEDLPNGTTVQTSDVFGGYVLWRHPELNPVIDGYSDAYTTPHLQAQLELQRLLPGWDRTLEDTGVRVALVPTKSPLAYALTSQQGWHTVHRSENVVLLEAPVGGDDR